MSDSSSPKKESVSTSRRKFIKYGVAGAVGFGVASAIEIPVLSNALSQDNSKIDSLNGQVSSLQGQVSSDQTQIGNLQAQLAQNQALLTLNIDERRMVEAMAEAIIPSDQNGPGAKEADVLFFIDRQLAGEYGNNARMYMKGPFVPSGKSESITVGGVTYPQGTFSVPYSGPTYQYNMQLREFWRNALKALQDYCNSAYGSNFEKLTSAQQVQVLTDLYDNKPASFNGILPRDFFNEVIFMVWSGFLMDPAHGGNQQLVGWKLTGFNGPNMGDFYGEGLKVTDLMVANKPTRLQPASLAQFEAKGGLIGGT